MPIIQCHVRILIYNVSLLSPLIMKRHDHTTQSRGHVSLCGFVRVGLMSSFYRIVLVLLSIVSSNYSRLANVAYDTFIRAAAAVLVRSDT